VRQRSRERRASRDGHEEATAAQQDGSPPATRWLGPSQSAVALISSIVALIFSVPAGIYTLVPALSPDPKTRVDATLKTLALDRNVTYAQYLRRPHHRLEASEPDRNGNVFYIRAIVDGFKRESLRVRWFTYEATNGVRIESLGSTAKLEQIIRPEAPVNTQIAQVWVPTPPHTGDYFVRFELYTGGDTLLSFVDSARFHVEEA
jgi:hypothetical protein